MTSIDTSMTVPETVALEKYERIITRGLRTFYEVGNALMVIRDEKLYRASHDTFEAYCRDRWGMSDRHARRLVDATAVVNKMQELTGPMGPVPTSERQARELVGLEPAAAVEVMREAGVPVSAAAIRGARLALSVPPPRTGPKGPVRPDRKRRPLTDDMRNAIDALEKAANRFRKIAADDRFDQYAIRIATDPTFNRAVDDLLGISERARDAGV
jgi:hypothetical protein